jgi:signal transduction histidine kinase
LGVAWALLAGVYAWLGVASRRPLRAWGGLSLFALAYGELVAVSADGPASVWATGAGFFGACAAILVVIGVGHELKLAFNQELDRAFALEVDVERRRWQGDAEDLERDARRHDQRAALTAIAGAVEQLVEHDPVLAGAVRHELGRLRRSLERSEWTIVMQPVDLRAHLLPMVACVLPAGVHIDVDVEDGLVVDADPDALGDLWQNLLNNALEHGGGHGVRVLGRAVGDRIELVVEDDGPGVPEASRESIFAPGASSKACAGSGMGLFSARRLMQAMGGHLVVERGEHGGARFVAGFRGTRRAVGAVATTGDG